MNKTVGVLLFTIFATTSVQATADERWQSGFGQGILEYWVKNKSNDTFMLTCDVGSAAADGPGAMISINKKDPPAQSTVTIRTQGKNYQLFFDKSGKLNTDCHSCADNWVHLWSAIRRGKTMKVTYPHGEAATFSLQGASKALPKKACTPQFYN